MANESDLYDQFSDFSYRKILFALMSWEEKEEEEGKKRKKEEEMKEREHQQQQQRVIPIDKRQLVKNFFQEVNDLYPLPKGATLNSVAIKFYQLKKELLNCDPNWKFMTSDFRYLSYTLPLLDAILIASEQEIPNVSRCVKVCMELCRDTRRRKKEDPLWNLDVESLVDFLYPQLSKEEESGAASPEINMGVRCSAAEMY
jgi:hypothetical protein